MSRDRTRYVRFLCWKPHITVRFFLLRKMIERLFAENHADHRLSTGDRLAWPRNIMHDHFALFDSILCRTNWQYLRGRIDDIGTRGRYSRRCRLYQTKAKSIDGGGCYIGICLLGFHKINAH